MEARNGELLTGFGGQLGSLFSAFGEISANYNDAELQRLQEIVDATEEGSDERLAAEEKLAKTKKKFAREEAIAQKAIGTFNTLINTAQAIVGFLANPGGIPGLALSGLAGAVGAAQLAAIQSQPLPALATGGAIPSRSGGVPVIVAEDSTGSGEVILGLGEKGTALVNELADRISARVGGNRSITVPVSINGKVIATAVADEFRNGTVRYQ
jgi:hypothetical protein